MTKMKFLGICNFLLKAAPASNLFLITIYFISDILTSPQTYNNSVRTFPKILLVLLLIDSFVFSLVFFFSGKKSRPLQKSFILMLSFGIVLSLLPLLNDFFRSTITSNSFTLAIYPLTFICLFSFWYLAPYELFSKKVIYFWLLFFSYVVCFFLIFFFFKVRGTPQASLNYRTPILSHVYLLIGLLPLSYSLFRIKGFVYFLFLCILFCLISDKGTPQISLGIILFVLVCFFLFAKNKKFLYFFTFLMIGLFLSVLLADILIFNKNLISKFFDESIMIRLNGYKTIIDSFFSFSYFEFFFGKGSAAVIALRGGLAAHNDLLEYLYDFGLVGVISFVGFILALFKILFSKSNWFFLVIVLSIILPITFFSAIFTNTNLPFFLSLGICSNREFLSNKMIHLSFTKRMVIYDKVFL